MALGYDFPVKYCVSRSTMTTPSLKRVLFLCGTYCDEDTQVDNDCQSQLSFVMDGYYSPQ